MLKQISRPIWIVALAHLVLEICNNFLPIVYPIFKNELGLSYTQVGITAMVAGVTGTLTQPLFGYLSDRWHARHLTVLSVVFIGLVMGLVGFVQHYPALLLLAALGGLGSAAFHPAGASVVLTRSSGSRRGRAASIFSVSGNLGTALSSLWIISAITVLGIGGTVTLIPLVLVTGVIVYQQLKSAEKFEFAASNKPALPHPKKRTGVMIGLLMIVMAVMARTWFQISLVTYLPEWIQGQGFSLVYGGQLLAVMLVAVGVGSLTGGTLSDYIGRWQVILISMVMLIPIYWLFMLTSGPVQMALTAMIGVLIGASFPVGLVMAQDAWPHRVGVATSLVIGVGWVTGGIGASVTGYLADKYSLTLGLQFLVLAPIVGVLCVLVYALLQRQQSVSHPTEELTNIIEGV
jgi:FSR family fosmidomycin resistance protein-like MFS transporter